MILSRSVDTRTTISVVLAVLLAFGMLASLTISSLASGHLLAAFTQDELDDNWEADRAFPSGGVSSVSAFGRDDVARLDIDSSSTATGTFQRTEGIKTAEAQNFGSSVQVDLYLDPDWQDKAARAGLWVVGDDGDGNRDSFFGILEFVHNEPCEESDCSNPSNITDHEGFRIWDSTVGWSENLDFDFDYGEWVTLKIELDAGSQEYNYYINDELVGSAAGGENFIREIFLNSYNYGEDDFPTLSEESYAAHWHAGIANPESKNECKKGGWQEFGFKNQGQCIKFVNTDKDSR